MFHWLEHDLDGEVSSFFYCFFFQTDEDEDDDSDGESDDGETSDKPEKANLVQWSRHLTPTATTTSLHLPLDSCAAT